MKNKTIFKKFIWLIAAAFFALFFLFESAFSIVAKADETSEETTETKYTDVLEDLQKDDNFNADDYPAISNDYSLQVIQIAESSDSELFVYVYQPSHATKDLTASSVRLAMPTVGVETTWNDYAVTLVSENGVFDKYVVNGVTVSSNSSRYYEIVCIHRPFDETIDDPTDEEYDQEINTMVYTVAKKWQVMTVNGETFFECLETQVVTITSKIVGHVRYDNGFSWIAGETDSHFVAFSCDWEIDELMEVDLSFSWVLYHAYDGGGNVDKFINEMESGNEFITIHGEDTGTNDAFGWFGKEYTWQRIESVESFIKNEGEDCNLHNATLSDLEGKQWILRFYETEYDFFTMAAAGGTGEAYTRVLNVTILRLKFETDGVVYNLGVVDNHQTGPDDPFASADTKFDDFMEGMEDWFNRLFNGIGTFAKILLICLVVVLVAVIVAILMPVILAILKIVFKVLAGLLKAVWWLLCFPFNVIGKLVKKRKNKDK